MKKIYVAFLVILFNFLSIGFAAEQRPPVFDVVNETGKNNFSMDKFTNDHNYEISDITLRVTLSVGHENVDWIQKNALTVNKISLPTPNRGTSNLSYISDPEASPDYRTDKVSLYVTCTLSKYALQKRLVDSQRRYIGVYTLSIHPQPI